MSLALYDVVYRRYFDDRPQFELVMRHAIQLDQAFELGENLAKALYLKAGMANGGGYNQGLDERVRNCGLQEGVTYNWLTVMPNDVEEYIYVRPVKE